jgi:hypothetical protein
MVCVDELASESWPTNPFAVCVYNTICASAQRGIYMATDKFDYARLVSDIDAKIAALQALRASVQAAGAVGALGEANEGMAMSAASAPNADAGQPFDLPEGAFHGKSLPACIELYLSAAKRKKTIKEIAVALREGGIESTSDNFENVINGALFRLKKAGKVLRFKDGWGLPAWYPANIREAATSGAGKRQSPKKKAKKAQAKSKASTPASAAITMPSSPSAPVWIEPSAAPEGAQGKVLQFLKSHSGTELSASEIATPLGLKIQTAHFVLGKLAWKKVIEKMPSGNYKMAAVQ